MAGVDPKNFLSRWARRKLVATLNRQPGAESASIESPLENSKSDADVELHRLALRTLFKEPQFAVRDGLDDYDGDYTFFEARDGVLTQDLLRVLERAEKMPADACGEAAGTENRVADQVGTARSTETDVNTPDENSGPGSGA